MNRRDLVLQLGSMAALAVSGAPTAFAAGEDIVIGAIYPMSGPSAQAGVDAKIGRAHV